MLAELPQHYCNLSMTMVTNESNPYPYTYEAMFCVISWILSIRLMPNQLRPLFTPLSSFWLKKVCHGSKFLIEETRLQCSQNSTLTGVFTTCYTSLSGIKMILIKIIFRYAVFHSERNLKLQQAL